MKIDLSPLFHACVGYGYLDKFLQDLTKRFNVSSYPYYNILKFSIDNKRISIALASFVVNNLDLTMLIRARDFGKVIGIMIKFNIFIEE